MAAAAAAGPFTPADEKYDVAGSIGHGGMGEVLLVEDRDLRRQAAMKILRDDWAGQPAHRLKFVAEAQATSQLEHPGIPPVHDIGIKPSGQIYFTMKLVRGKTLAEVIKDLFVGSKTVRREYTLHKLASILERICEAVHFAHEKGVIHRDLKPENIMLGEYGEVHVMDWGIAKVAGDVGDDGAGNQYGDEYDDFADETADTVRTAGIDALMTIDGAIKGTIPYMSPEQAGGEPLDRRSDVYALGCLLYEMLALHPAYTGGGMELLAKVRAGEFADVRARNPRRPVPEPLAELCEQAMSRAAADRPETAWEFGASLRDWLDGRAERARKHKEAEALAKQGIDARRRYESLRTEADAAEQAADAMKGDFKPWQSVNEKTPWLAAQRAVTDLRRDMAVAFADATALLNAALAAEERNTTATRALGDLWATRLAETELQGAADDAAHALTMLTRYDDGRHAGLLAGDGSLALTSDPPGAEVLLSRFEEEHGVLVPVEERSLAKTPTARLTLPMGSYLCTLRLPGYRDVRYPVHITRGRAWKGTVRMRTEDETPEEFVYVPGGPFVYGEGKDTATKDLSDFLIKRTPVTFGEYAEYLTALDAESGEDAVAYCEWKTRVTGREWRLPTEEEREKAARGVDGRRFPWGDAADASLCKNTDSRAEPTQPEPVGAFPTAESVYGMLDAGGGVWDWTSSLFEPLREASSSRVLRESRSDEPDGAKRSERPRAA